MAFNLLNPPHNQLPHSHSQSCPHAQPPQLPCNENHIENIKFLKLLAEGHETEFINLIHEV